MKKIFSLLAALLLLSVTSVKAADETSKKVTSVATTATPAADIRGGYFLIKIAAKGNEGYAYYNGNSSTITGTNGGCFLMNYSGLSTDTIGSHGSLAYVWYVSQSADGKMLSMQCAGNGAFFPMQNGHGKNFPVAKTLANAAAFYYSEASDKGVNLYQTNYKIGGQNIYIHANDGTPHPLSYWEGGTPNDGSGSACRFSFYAVTLADGVTTAATPSIPVSYVQQIDGVDNGDSFVYVEKIGSAPSHTSPWTFSNFYSSPVVSTTPIESNTLKVPVACTTNSTPAVTFSTNDNITYYKLKIRGTGEKWVLPSGTSIPTNLTPSDNSNSNDFLQKFDISQISQYWYFEKYGFGLKMRNGNGKYVKVAGNNDAATLADDGSVFYLQGAPSNASSSDFTLQYDTDCYLGDHKNGNIGTWTSASNPGAANDAGSGYTIVSTSTEADLVAALKTELTTRLKTLTQPTSLNENFLRVATPTQVEAALTAANAATTLNDIKAAYNTAFAPQPEANAYYRIKVMGDYDKVYPSSEDIAVGSDGTLSSGYHAASNPDSFNRTIERKTANDKLVPQLWFFVSNGDGTYKIKNANNNCCWANATSNIDMPISEDYGGNYRFVAIPTNSQAHSGNISAHNDGVSTFQLKLGTHTINAANGVNGTKIGTYDNHDEDNSNYWQFEKITTIPVAISAAKYATVGFPFTTRVTTDGVKVFYATKAENGWISLTEAEDKIIPAGQGAILYNEAGATTANLEITNDVVTFNNNLLTGTAARRVGFTTLSTYGLGQSSTGEVCFMKNESTDVPANKAYLAATNYTESTGNAQKMLRFAFDGGVIDGITNVANDIKTSEKAFYDLQGRRVLYPAHGIYVTEKGEKVFLK